MTVLTCCLVPLIVLFVIAVPTFVWLAYEVRHAPLMEE